MWKEIVPKVSNTNRVLAIDLLGHGQTDCLGYVHSMELMADEVLAVLKLLRIRKITIIGHSMGGYVSLALAEKHPEMIRGLCLLNSTANSDSTARKKLRARANKMVQDNFTNMVRMSFVNLFEEERKSLFKSEIENALNKALKTPLQGYIACQEGMKIRPDRTNVLKNNTFKKLMILGKKDPVLNNSDSLKEAKQTNSEIVMLSGGHMSYIENKIDLITALKKFIKQCLQ
jgi:pimeloyl-ACP methyl ester carboxylesterase